MIGAGPPSLKLTLEDLLDLSGAVLFGGTGSAARSWLERLMVSSIPSASERVSSSSSSCGGLPLVMRKTPKKVKRQPPTNFMACSRVVRSKSR